MVSLLTEFQAKLLDGAPLSTVCVLASLAGPQQKARLLLSIGPTYSSSPFVPIPQGFMGEGGWRSVSSSRDVPSFPLFNCLRSLVLLLLVGNCVGIVNCPIAYAEISRLHANVNSYQHEVADAQPWL